MAKKVLLCDDEPHILRAAEFKLSRAGFAVTTASNGLEAWQAIQADRPDILVTDLQMPQMNGLELSRRVREAFAPHELPIIMLTAKSFEPAHVDEAVRIGVLTVLPKPFSPRELLRAVESVLESGAVGVSASA